MDLSSAPSALSSVNLGTYAGIAAACALIAGLWGKIVTGFTYLSNLVVCKVGIFGTAARAMQTHVWTHGKRSPFAVRSFSGERMFVRPKKRVESIAYERICESPMLLWFGRVPVIIWVGGRVTGTQTHFGGSTEGLPMSVIFIRGTIDFDALLERAIVEYNQLSAAAKDSNPDVKRPKRFNVHRIGRSTTGDSGVVSGFGKGSDTQKSSAPEAPSSDSGDLLKRLQHKEVRLVTWSADDLVEQLNDKPPFDLYPYEPHQMAVLPELDTWLKHENWFRSKGIPHRRGMLLTGAPGTGKSTFVRSVAIKLDLPIYTFDLATLDNRAFADEWRGVQANAPAIILLEDLDTLYHGREFIAPVSKNRDPLTFDCLLNTISGVGSSDGILLFVTTNHLEHLDPALGIPSSGETSSGSTRPGRLDKVIHFGPMLEPQRRKLAEFILDAWPERVDEIVAAGEGETAAQFQYRCSQFAERCFWERGVDGKALEEALVPVVVAMHPKLTEADKKRFALQRLFDSPTGRILSG